MIKLHIGLYVKVLEPLRKIEINNLFALDVVKQKVDGDIYVDNEDDPKTFLIKHPYGMSLLLGENDKDEFNIKLKNYLLNKDNIRTNVEFLQVYPDNWDKNLKELLNGNLIKDEKADKSKVILNGRVNFKFNPDKFNALDSCIDSDYMVKRTSSNFFHEIKGSVIPEFFYRDKDQFEREGVAYSVFYKEKPVSTAFAAFIHENKLELGIETHEDFRGKGLAKLACVALIDYCLQNNYEPVWACRAENPSSYYLALSLGFKPIRQISYYKLPCN